MVEVKYGNPKGRGLMILEFGEHGGRQAFWNFLRQGGVKMFMPPMVGYGHFLESPNVITGNSTYSYTVPCQVKGSGHNMELRTLQCCL